MADTNSTPQKITTVAQFLNELVPESEHQQLIAAFRDPHSSTLHAMIEQYASVKGQPINITDILEDSKQYIHHTESSPSQETNSKERRWRRWGVNRGSAAEQIAISIQEEASQKLLADFEKAVGENRIADATNLINSLSAERFLSTQVGALKARVPSEFHTTIDTEHQKIKNSPKTKDIQELQKHIDMLGSIIHEGMSEKEKQNLISEFQQRLLLQKRATFHDFSEIVTGNKRRFFRKVSIFPRDVEKKLLQNFPVRKTDKEKQVSKKTFSTLTEAREEEHYETDQYLPLLSQESAFEKTPGWDMAPIQPVLPRGGTGFRIPAVGSFLGNGLGGGEAVTAAGNPVFWYILGGAIAVIFLIILFVVIYNFLNGGFPDTSTVDGFITTIPCGVSLQDAQRDLTTTGSTDSIFTQLIRDRFAISFTDGRAITDTPTDADNTLFQTLCLMYGRDPTHYTLSDDKSVRGYLNTFGQLFLGLPIMTYQAGAESGLGRSGYTSLKYFDVGQTLCDDSYKLSGQSVITLKQPSLCDGIDTGFALEFKIARNMGFVLYDRIFENPPYSSTIGSHDTVDKATVDKARYVQQQYDGFFATESAKILPTYQCQSASPKDAARQCFADMIGEYMSYPYYFDDGTTFPYYSSSTPPTTQPTPSPFPSQLSNFSNPANAYYDWYKFAHDNLFDNQDFFSISSSSANESTDYALHLTQDVQKACAGSGNTGTIYGHYYVIVDASNASQCLKTISPTYDLTINGEKHSVTQQMIASANDPNNHYDLQCIGFSQATSNGIDGDSHSIRNCFISLPGTNYGPYNVTCPANIPYAFIPKDPSNSGKHNSFPILPGDFALFVWSDFGHIAYVISSQENASGGTASFVVSEANGSNGSVDISKTYQVDQYLIGVLRHK